MSKESGTVSETLAIETTLPLMLPSTALELINHFHGKTADFRFNRSFLKRNDHQKNALEVLINVNM